MLSFGKFMPASPEAPTGTETAPPPAATTEPSPCWRTLLLDPAQDPSPTRPAEAWKIRAQAQRAAEMKTFLLPLLGEQMPVMKLKSPMPAHGAPWNELLEPLPQTGQAGLPGNTEDPSSAEGPIPTQLRPPGLAHSECLTDINYCCHYWPNNYLLSTRHCARSRTTPEASWGLRTPENKHNLRYNENK